jgi:hypothetical protein
MGNNNSSVYNIKENKIIDISNNINSSESNENVANQIDEKSNRKTIEYNHYINSTELRLPSYFKDLSYDESKNK